MISLKEYDCIYKAAVAADNVIFGRFKGENLERKADMLKLQTFSGQDEYQVMIEISEKLKKNIRLHLQDFGTVIFTTWGKPKTYKRTITLFKYRSNSTKYSFILQ